MSQDEKKLGKAQKWKKDVEESLQKMSSRLAILHRSVNLTRASILNKDNFMSYLIQYCDSEKNKTFYLIKIKVEVNNEIKDVLGSMQLSEYLNDQLRYIKKILSDATILIGYFGQGIIYGISSKNPGHDLQSFKNAVDDEDIKSKIGYACWNKEGDNYTSLLARTEYAYEEATMGGHIKYLQLKRKGDKYDEKKKDQSST